MAMRLTAGLIIALLVLANLAIVSMFLLRTVAWRWWTALLTAWVSGSVLGVWGGFFCEYRPLPDLRVAGAPIPAAFFHWEGPPGQEQWVDFITPAPRINAASNVVILSLLAGCPIGVIFWLARNVRATESIAGDDLAR